MASNTELPSGYDYECVEQVPEDYICGICFLAMLKPVQTKCGHQFCKDCLDAALARKRQCPLDNKPLTSEQVFDDLATERGILSLKIKCPNHCDWQGELRDVKGPRRSLDDHYKINMAEHLDAITRNQLLTIQDENKKQVAELKTELMNLFQEESRKHSRELTAKNDEFNMQLKTLEDESKKQIDELKTQLETLQEESKDLEKQVLEVKENYTPMTKRYIYTWRINDFSKQLQIAKQQDRDIVLFSEPFHTHQSGYKLRLRLDPNGNRSAKGTHVSVFMVIMRGQYDAILTWPFNWRFKFTLLDQKADDANRKSIGVNFVTPDTQSDAVIDMHFQRPTTDENPGFGFPTFVSQQTLKTEKYVVDGVIFIRFELESPCTYPSPCTMIMTKDDPSQYSFTWKINDFSKQLQLAKQKDRDIKLYSEPVYTDKYGYKLKLQLDPNGQGAGKGTHVSVFMIIMPGEYDAILTWPFNWKHKFILLDQKQDYLERKHITSGAITPDAGLSSFQRPTKGENTGRGFPKFVSHENLQTENYVVDGAVFIKFEWEKP